MIETIFFSFNFFVMFTTIFFIIQDIITFIKNKDNKMILFLVNLSKVILLYLFMILSSFLLPSSNLIAWPMVIIMITIFHIIVLFFIMDKNPHDTISPMHYLQGTIFK